MLGCYIRFSSVKGVVFSMWCVLGSPQQQRTAAALGGTTDTLCFHYHRAQHLPPHNCTTYTHLNQSNPFHLHISHLFIVLVLVHLHMLLINKNCIFVVREFKTLPFFKNDQSPTRTTLKLLFSAGGKHNS